MSRILEFQHADEQTVVARVLLDLHQAIDLHFPQAKGSSRQFSKTVLATQTEGTSVENQPLAVAAANVGASAGGAAVAIPAPSIATPKPPKSKVGAGSGIEFSKHGTGAFHESITATMMQEAGWSRWLTRVLLLALFIGTVLLAWIYMFGVPQL